MDLRQLEGPSSFHGGEMQQESRQAIAKSVSSRVFL
jgi:hypothetical protein